MTLQERLKHWYDEDRALSRAEGRVEGQRNLLAKQLKLKFGPLDEATQARIAGATPAQLGRWAERVLTASSL